MSKKYILLILMSKLLFLNNCSSFSPSVYFGSAVTVVSSGNVPKAAIQYSVNDLILKKTGKTPTEHLKKTVNMIMEDTTIN